MLTKAANKHLTIEHRLQFEALLRGGLSISEAGRVVGCSRSTAYNEYKRGKVEQLDSELLSYWTYDAHRAQAVYDLNATAKGKPDKLGNRHDFAHFVSEAIRSERYSPYAALEAWRRTGDGFSVCVRTLYTYIDRGWIDGVTNKDLPMRGEVKREYKKVKHPRNRKPLQRSIEERPREISKRGEFGHWELDTVIGQRTGKNSVLAVFTERKTRYEFVFKVPGKTQAAIVAAVDELERRFGGDFSRVFKTITMDNGCEFSDDHGIERSIFNHMQKRTQTYYCHPYNSCERGSNENANKLVRRWVPKGSPIDQYDQSYIQHVQEWMNNLPRRKLKGRTAAELFAAELARLDVSERGINHVA